MTVLSPASAPTDSYAGEPDRPAAGIVFPLLRVSLGFLFLWAFLDKAFSLGFATGRSDDGSVDILGPKAWINGGSPTRGFLSNAASGPLTDVSAALAGHPVVDAAFMFGLLSVGLALIGGFALRLAAIGGVVLMLLIRAAAPVPANNPLIDEHVVYALALAAVAMTPAARRFSLSSTWERLPVVRNTEILR